MSIHLINKIDGAGGPRGISTIAATFQNTSDVICLKTNSQPPRDSTMTSPIDSTTRMFTASTDRMRIMTSNPSTATLTLFGRQTQNNCVKCDESVKLVCPPCEPGKSECQFIFPTDCTECARATCSPLPPSASTPSSGSTANIGAIAGGVLGGVVAISAITYLVWRYCIRTRRQAIDQEEWDDQQAQGDIAEKTFAQRRDNRSSAAHSIASTVLTRASNIIQIAYVPGVTSRAAATSPTLLVPPVPPIPIGHSQATSPAGPEDQHFFVPGDLRDSTYSGLSSFTDRTSFARTSYAPRSSVASTIYAKNAVIAAPAQTGMRAKPAMVSVRSANSNGSGGTSTPPVPSVDYDKYNSGLMRPPSPANSTFSVGSTFLNNASAHTATPARAMVVRVGSVKKIGVNKPKTPDAPVPTSTASPSSSSVAGPRESNTTTIIIDSPASDQGPFSDPPRPRPTSRSSGGAQSSASLSAVIEESTRRASQRDLSGGGVRGGRERSPFGDEHATQE